LKCYKLELSGDSVKICSRVKVRVSVQDLPGLTDSIKAYFNTLCVPKDTVIKTTFSGLKRISYSRREKAPLMKPNGVLITFGSIVLGPLVILQATGVLSGTVAILYGCVVVVAGTVAIIYLIRNTNENIDLVNKYRIKSILSQTGTFYFNKNKTP